MTKKKEPYKWGTLRRVKMSVTMRGNTNAIAKSFSSELADEYADDPEVLAWIQSHRAELDASNEDGSVPMSTTEIEKTSDRHAYDELQPGAGSGRPT